MVKDAITTAFTQPLGTEIELLNLAIIVPALKWLVRMSR